MTAIDLRRAVPLRVVDADAIDGPDSLPGDAVPTERDGGVPAGFIFRCPGCGAQACLGLAPRLDQAPAWNVTAGDPRTGAGLSLTPSIHHTTALGGCGWHGYLRVGVFTPLG
ncbi:MAG: DUF6527 family protein [Myxococcales bacterium]|nr:DUF6527 family protein [Myxococcales bacterium]